MKLTQPYCEIKVHSKPIILFRSDIDMENELSIASKHITTVDSRVLIPDNSSVIARYSVLPWYQELERDLAHRSSKLLNSYREHKFIADLLEWGGPYGVLKGLTPQSWSNWSRLPDNMSFVVKGRVNSRKQNWATQMFAETKTDVSRVAAGLLGDSLIGDQGIIVREYVPLKQLDIGLNGLPIANEWRTFWVKNQAGEIHQLCKGYYWRASHPDSEADAAYSDEAEKVVRKAAEIVSEYCTFFVLDVAETAAGDWIIVEVNDAQMSGLCGCSAEELYGNLARVI